MNRLLSFLNNMDARAWRTVAVSLLLLAVVGAMIVVGKTGLIEVDESIQVVLAQLREGPWGLPAVVLLFCVTAYFAAPQFVLIGACVVAFGPVLGFAYSWVGTMASGALTFWTGRLAGHRFLQRFGGGTINRMSRFIGRNDFVASLIVRNVPTAPFIVVNMAFGVSHASFWRYMAGMAIGIIPKTGIVALLGHSALSAMGGAPVLAMGLALSVVGVWVTVALAARKAVSVAAPVAGDGAVREVSEEEATVLAGDAECPVLFTEENMATQSAVTLKQVPAGYLLGLRNDLEQRIQLLFSPELPPLQEMYDRHAHLLRSQGSPFPVAA